MLGLGGPTGINKHAPIQIQAGLSVQPFGRLETHAAEVFAWTKKSNGIFGPKGTLSFLGRDSGGLGSKTTNIKGLFNIANPQESNIFTRALSYMANRGSTSTAEMNAAADGSKLKFIDRFKKMFDVDEEQPNSLFRLAKRFRKRQYDINNPQVMMKLIMKDEVVHGKTGRALRLEGNQVDRKSTRLNSSH